MKSITVIGHMHLNPDNREPFEMMMEDYDVKFRYPDRWKGSLGEVREDEAGFKIIRLPMIPLSYIPLSLSINESGIVWIDEEPVFPQTEILLKKSENAGIRIVRSAQNIVKRDFFRNRANRAVNGRADIICAVSEGSQKCIMETFGRKFVPIIPLHIPDRFFSIRSRREFKEDGLKIGYAARLEKEKGTGLFTEFARSYAGKAKFVIAGDGRERNRMIAELKESGVDFEYRGFIDHQRMDGFYSGIDIFINTPKETAHWKEQQGRTVLEALAAGCIVITTECGDIRSTLKGYELFAADRRSAAIESIVDRVCNDASFRAEQIEKGRTAALKYSKKEVYREIAGMIDEYEHIVS